MPKNKRILLKNFKNSRKVEWVEMRSKDGFRRFETVLDNLKIPHEKLSDNFDKKLEIILKEIFNRIHHYS